MISDFLDRDYVVSQTRAQRDWLLDLQKKARAKDVSALRAMKRHGISLAQIQRAIAALGAALKEVPSTIKHSDPKAFIPSDPILCNFQAGATQMAERRANTVAAEPKATVRRAVGRAKRPIDTSPTECLKNRSVAGTRTGPGATVAKAPFVEGDDIHYGLDGFAAKFGALFKKRRKFNRLPARVAATTKPLTLYVFGDWGTGLALADAVARSIRKQLDAASGTRQQHVLHLGDVYYVGEAGEYRERVFPIWPVRGEEKNSIGSWSLNGNHDMYSGGHGYFDTLLREPRFLRWHADANGAPSSFFLIEDPHWQFFGLDTSWNIPSLGSAIFGKPTLKDYGGQNGVLTREQAVWMASVRNPAKGCVLLTHHQPASSRSSEAQHAKEAVAMLKNAGVYSQIDAWLWGHEHRAVVFKPKAKRADPRLADAPAFCACVGHGGVPVTEVNFERKHKLADVAWEEDRIDNASPFYEGERVVPFGFARIDTQEGAFDFRIYDHDGGVRYHTLVVREGTPSSAPASGRSKAPGARRSPAARKASPKKPRPKAKRPAKSRKTPR